MSIISIKSCLGVIGATAVLAIAPQAVADGLTITEKPGHITEATVIIDASPAQVYALATDYANWMQILTDVRSVKVVSGGREDARVRFKSHALGHEFALQFANEPDRAIRFRGVDAPPGARAHGEYRLEPIDQGTRTRVLATLYIDVFGLPSLFVSDKSLRSMRQAKLRADLGDVARWFANARRARG